LAQLSVVIPEDAEHITTTPLFWYSWPVDPTPLFVVFGSVMLIGVVQVPSDGNPQVQRQKCRLSDGLCAGRVDSEGRAAARRWRERTPCGRQVVGRQVAAAVDGKPQICAISGHSPRSVQTIIEHYLGATRELADAGIDKLVAWMEREGIAV
jgi:hypothetical protein